MQNNINTFKMTSISKKNEIYLRNRQAKSGANSFKNIMHNKIY